MMTVQIIKRMCKIAFVCITRVLLVCAAGCAGQAVKSDPYNSATGGAILAFPDDHKLHNGPITENENFQE